MLSIFWAFYNAIPPSLFIFYCFNKGQIFEDFCSFCLTVSYLMAIGGIICTWLVPDDYNLGQVLNVSLQFFEAQRSGKVPRISNTPWRGNSGLWDSIILPNGKNYSLVGGWYDDGGMLKLSYTTAFTVSMLSWGEDEMHFFCKRGGAGLTLFSARSPSSLPLVAFARARVRPSLSLSEPHFNPFPSPPSFLAAALPLSVRSRPPPPPTPPPPPPPPTPPHPKTKTPFPPLPPPPFFPSSPPPSSSPLPPPPPRNTHRPSPQTHPTKTKTKKPTQPTPRSRTATPAPATPSSVPTPSAGAPTGS